MTFDRTIGADASGPSRWITDAVGREPEEFPVADLG